MNNLKNIVMRIFFSILFMPEILSTAVSVRDSQEVLGETILSKKGNDFKILSTNSVGTTGADDADYRFLIIGGTHGDEVMTSEFVAWLYKRTASGRGRFAQIGSNVVFDFIPVLNVDNFGKSRYNENDVNLNRNYSVNWGKSVEHFGQEPFSENETKLVKALYDKFDYTAAADIHGFIDWVVAPSLPHRMSTHANYENTKKYTKWLGALKKNLHRLPGDDYQVLTDMNLNDGGAFEDWSFWQRDTPAFCLELSESITEADKEVKYKMYETYLFKMFREAIRIKKGVASRHL
jgi:hypothetical protein